MDQGTGEGSGVNSTVQFSSDLPYHTIPGAVSRALSYLFSSPTFLVVSNVVRYTISIIVI